MFCANAGPMGKAQAELARKSLRVRGMFFFMAMQLYVISPLTSPTPSAIMVPPSVE